MGLYRVYLGVHAARSDLRLATNGLSEHCEIWEIDKVQKAFEDELKVAGAFAQASPRVTLTGHIPRLEFSSSRALTGGSWTIDLVLTSSNGNRMTVAEYYEFQSGFIATEACRQTAEAYSRALQNLIGKTVRSPEFANLVR